MKFKSLIFVVFFCVFAIGSANQGKRERNDGLPNFIMGKADGKQIPVPLVLRRKPKEAKAGDDELRKLMIARYNIALLEAQKRFAAERWLVTYAAQGTDQTVKRLFEAEFAIADDAKTRVAACADYLELAKFLEASVAEIVAAAVTENTVLYDHVADFERCRFLRADAEIRLLEAKRQQGAKAK
jgi:hypothetical protein